MLKINKSLSLFLFILLIIGNKGRAQNQVISERDRYYQLHVFDKDSLSGFDEVAARRAAISDGFKGIEFPRKMFTLKRQYINAKYNITPQFIPYTSPIVAKTAVVPGCTNEDFEASTAGTITSNNAISGWSLSSGSNDESLGPLYNSCNLGGCCPSTTSASAIFTTPFIDATIGSQYQIYSVFGTSTTNSLAAAAANTQVSQPMLGNTVIRINNDVTGDYGIEKLSKTFNVTANNALFQFAFISIFAPGHLCCDAPGFRIRLLNASGNNSLIPCPTFSVAAPGPNCAAGVGTPNYLTVGTGAPQDPNSPSYIYNPWQISSIDLTPYIGSNITIEVILTDCDQGGHFGYCYFDAQCGPMTIYGNGTPFSAGTTSATVPTCGAAGATLCAVDGLGPFSWAGPGVGPPYTLPAMSNQCYTTNISGTFTLYMNPAGSCAPISRVISSTITPAPLLAASVVQAVCGSTTAIVTLTPSGSAAVPSSITWTQSPLALSGNSMVGTYGIPTGTNPAYVVTVTAVDPLGCHISVTPTINPAAPIPTFSITNVSGTPSITCAHPFVDLLAATNYTYGTLTYSWISQNTYSVSDEIGAYSPGIFTITAEDPISQCAVVLHYTVGINLTAPVSLITPSLQNITCLVAAQTVTSISTPTSNISHYFITPPGAGGAVVAVTSPTAIYSPSFPGDYRDSLVNLVTGCSSVHHFTVNSSDNFPLLSVSSSQNFTLGCSTHSVQSIVLSATSTPVNGAAIGYTLLPPSFTGTTYAFGSNPGFPNIITPGTYTAIAQDNNNSCQTKVPFSIISNTVGPDAAANVPNNLLTCYTPSTTLTGITSDPNVTWGWSYPGPNGVLTVPNSSLVVNTTTNVNNQLVANFTLTITDNLNSCSSITVVTIQQNLYPPKANIGSSSTSVTCNTPSVQLTNNSTHGMPANSGLPINLPVIANWAGPTPQTPSYSTAVYAGFTPGNYTMTVTDLNNGCTSYTTINIADARNFPIVNNPTPAPIYTLDCGTSSRTITPIITGTTTNYSYYWTGPPTASLSGIQTRSLSTNTPGEYEILVTNLTSGCFVSGEVIVVNGVLTSTFTPDVPSGLGAASGFAPLTVNFANNTSSSLGSGSISSTWDYGNGVSTSSYIATSPLNGMAVYTQPGTYTVTLYTTKGTCVSTSTTLINVDIPSSLEVPNVFTPNGDNINDVFFLKVSNMTEITATIYDRWGRKVYELTSETGNIAWDGTNEVGTKVAAGVYFYTIKGTGKDNQNYNKKGTVTLLK